VRALAASRAHNSSGQGFSNTPTILLSAVKVRWDEAIRWGISLAWNAIQRHSLQSLLLLPMSGEEEARAVGAGHVAVHGSGDGAEPDGQPGHGPSHCLTLFPSLHKRIRLQNESQKSTSPRGCAIAVQKVPCRQLSPISGQVADRHWPPSWASLTPFLGLNRRKRESLLLEDRCTSCGIAPSARGIFPRW
jgi:hypothetical protein